ncbi:hypothetical protein BFJ69_g16110 [Fusarium oxysporum]|uniref:Uncharacterized protein n=1 Tax=Fusarium oxysporum TaxID=5507 RepID=A0A420MDS1_FUSOX|nr:hypothetical protein BFJ69_g16110 [Fusarium oxysporum]
MKEVMRSISETLGVEVTLPTIIDYQIDFLQRQACKWDTPNVLSRQLDMELLLSQQKQLRRNQKPEGLELDIGKKDVTVLPTVPRKLSWPTRYVLEDSIGLRYETLHYLLYLGDICPLSEVFRPGLRQWARDYRKSRWHNRRTFVCASIIEHCLQTEAGENLLGLLIFLWKTQRERDKRFKRPLNQQRRVAWLAQLLSSLFSVRSIPKSATPSIQQLQSFVYCIISAFKDKDLTHFYLILEARSQVKGAAPSSDLWSTAVPPRPNPLHRGLRSLKAWVSDTPYNVGLMDIDTAIDSMPDRSTTWDHSVAATSRILVLLHNIYASDRKQLLVYCGQDSSWVAFYAEVVLGLDVSYRKMAPGGAQAWHPTFSRSKQTMTGGRPDVVVYFGDRATTAEICELVDRIDVGQELFIV